MVRMENKDHKEYRGYDGIAIQPNEPTDEKVKLWYDTDDDSEEYIAMEDVKKYVDEIINTKITEAIGGEY